MHVHLSRILIGGGNADVRVAVSKVEQGTPSPVACLLALGLLRPCSAAPFMQVLEARRV